MATKLGVVLADFTTQLATAMAVGATTATLQSATDDDGVALPAGVYFFAIDGNNSQKEHIVCTLSGTSLTGISSVNRQGVQASGVVRSHRVGSTVTLTDFAHLRYINDLISGATTLNASVPLGYDGTASITTANQLATKAYVDGVAVAGAPTASTTVKGIVEEATQAEVLAKTATGGTGADLYINPTTLPSTLLSDYKVDTGAANAYVITPAPAITAYTIGQIFSFKAVSANTTASTLNVNALGVKTIKKAGSTDLIANDITAGYIVVVEYDGTNFQMINPCASAINFSGGAYPAASGAAITGILGSNVTSTPVYMDFTQADIGASSTAENTVYTFTINGGVLGTAGGVLMNIIAGGISTATAGQTATIRLKYGGTTMASFALTGTLFLNNTLLQIHLGANGATNAQNLQVIGVPTAVANANLNGFGTAAVDSTTNQTFLITIQFSDSQATNKWTKRSMVVSKL